MWKDINGKTGYKGLQGRNRWYSNVKTMLIGGDSSFLDDGIVEWITPTKPEPTPEELLSKAKLQRKAHIKAEYEWFNTQPVVDGNGVGWAAGFDSSLKLDGARRLAEQVGNTEVTFYSDDNQPQLLSIAEAINVVILVAGTASQALGFKNGLYDDVDSSTVIEDVNLVVSPWIMPEVF